MQSKNFCPVFLVCPLLKHRKVSVSYALADLPPTAKTPHFSFLQAVSNTLISLAGVCWPHHFTRLCYRFPNITFSTLTLTFKKEVAIVHENQQTAFSSSFHSMLFTKLYYLQQSTITECPQIYTAIYKHYPRKVKKLGSGMRRGRDVSTKRKYQSIT